MKHRAKNRATHLQGKQLTITMYAHTCTQAHMYPPTHTHTHAHTHTHDVSINALHSYLPYPVPNKPYGFCGRKAPCLLNLPYPGHPPPLFFPFSSIVVSQNDIVPRSISFFS